MHTDGEYLTKFARMNYQTNPAGTEAVLHGLYSAQTLGHTVYLYPRSSSLSGAFRAQPGTLSAPEPPFPRGLFVHELQADLYSPFMITVKLTRVRGLGI